MVDCHDYFASKVTTIFIRVLSVIFMYLSLYSLILCALILVTYMYIIVHHTFAQVLLELIVIFKKKFIAISLIDHALHTSVNV